MADKKYLDKGGLAHLWDKIKSYLTTWKTSNFGTGTGSLKMQQDFEISAKRESGKYSGPGHLTFTFDIDAIHGIMFPSPSVTDSTDFKFKNNTSETVNISVYYIGNTFSVNKTLNLIEIHMKIENISIAPYGTGLFDRDSVNVFFVRW